MQKKIVLALVSLPVVIALFTAAVFIDLSKKTNTDSVFPSVITVYDSKNSKILLISFDEFVEGCICGLLPNTGNIYEEQTLAALAVVISTNALAALKENDETFEAMGADITVSDEFPYVSYADKAINHADRKLIRSAVTAAKGCYLAFEGEPVKVKFCTVSSGKTQELLYMPSKELLEDTLAKGFLTERAFTEREIASLFSVINSAGKEPSEWFKDPVYDEYGSLVSIDLLSMKITGEQLRSALGLRSTAITAEYRDEIFYFKCRGSGDNAGMSLNAANNAAKNGSTFEEILAEYYALELISVDS